MPAPPPHPLAQSNPELYAHLMGVVDDVVRVQTAAMMRSFEGLKDNTPLDRRLVASIEAQGGRLEEPTVGALREFLHDERRVGEAKVLFLNACVGIYTAGYVVARRGEVLDGNDDEGDAGRSLSLEDLHVKSRKIP